MNLSELNEDRIGVILTWMANNERKYCEAKAALETARVRAKRIRAAVFDAADGTAGERNAEVELNEDVQAAEQAVIDAQREFNVIDMAYDRGRLEIDVWRTLSASRRAGMNL